MKTLNSENHEHIIAKLEAHPLKDKVKKIALAFHRQGYDNCFDLLFAANARGNDAIIMRGTRLFKGLDITLTHTLIHKSTCWYCIVKIDNKKLAGISAKRRPGEYTQGFANRLVQKIIKCYETVRRENNAE